MGGPAYAAPRRSGLRRLDLRRAVLHDFPLKMAALAIAVLAFVAVAESTQERTATFHLPVERPAAVPAGYVLRGTLGEVTVQLHGPQAQLEKLAAADVHPTLDLATADLGRGDVQPIAVRVIAPEGVVGTADPATVPARIEKLVSRTLPVQVRYANEPPVGFQPGTPSVPGPEVTASGAQSLVGAVTAVLATVRFGDSAVDIATNAQAIPVDAKGDPVEGVAADPPAVEVRVPVLSTASTRTVPVLWTVRGAVAAGYWISRVTTDPVAVTVRGPQEVLGALERIETAPVDVAGLTASRSFRVPLLLPAGVSLLQPTDANVGVTVVALSGTRPFPAVAVQVTGAGSGLVGETDPPTVSIVVSGPLPTLAALGPDAIGAVVDASGRGPGTSQADVTLRLPAGVALVSLQPARVTLTMRAR